MTAKIANTAAIANGRPIPQNHGSSRMSLKLRDGFACSFNCVANSFFNARAISRVSSIARCASGDSAISFAIVDLSGSSSSSRANAVNFGSSMFMSGCSGIKRDKIFRRLAVLLPQRFQRGVNQNADAVHGGLRDLGNLLIAEIVLKFELQHFLLPRRKCRQDLHEKSARFALLHSLERH